MNIPSPSAAFLRTALLGMVLACLPCAAAPLADRDGDHLADEFDAKPDAALDPFDPMQGGPAIIAVETPVPGGTVSRIGRSGSTLRIQALRLEKAGPALRVVIVDDAVPRNRNAASSSFPARRVGENLEISLDWPRPGLVRLFVTDGQRMTEPFWLQIVSPQAPLLHAAEAHVEGGVARLSLQGDKLTPDTVLSVNGKPLPVQSRDGSRQITAVLPAGLLDESVAQVRNSHGPSNEQPFVIQQQARVTIRLPKGYGKSAAGLDVLSAMLSETKADATGRASVVLMGACTQVSVHGLPADQGFYLSGAVAPSDPAPVIDVESTAIMAAFMPLMMAGHPPEEACSLRARAARLPEIQALARLIEKGLVEDKRVIHPFLEPHRPIMVAATQAMAALLPRAPAR